MYISKSLRLIHVINNSNGLRIIKNNIYIYLLVFILKIMAGIQDEHISTISISGRNLSNLRFADDIDLIAGSNDELKTHTNKLINSAMEFKLV